jgi:peptidoglycan/LPS O-acetylase OafA/YrhL
MQTTEVAPIGTRVRELTYVGGLDGLRALAVTAVVLYHFAPTVLPAGFLGVDVFFVVSGYLISRLLVGEIGRAARVSLRNFWSRRARRLLPAVGTMTVAVCIAAAISFDGVEIHDLRAQALGTLFYVANWVIIAGKGNYFASVGRPSPFLHMWTLAVEEQFYVVVPIIFFFARDAIVRRPARTAAVAFTGAVVSTIWMARLVSPGDDPTRAYLGTGSHSMGLLLGVALGVLASAAPSWEALRERLGSDRVSYVVANVAGMAAFVAIVLTMILASFTTYGLYRGGFLAFSAACGVLIVVVVLCPNAPLTKLLSASWLVEIGLRSYSLYLWHWPVRVFVTESSGLSGLPLFVVRLGLSVALAEVSYRCIEQPLRRGAIVSRTGSRAAITYYALCVLVTFILVAGVAAPGALPPKDLSAVPSNVKRAGDVRVDIFGDSTAFVFGYGGALHGAELHLTVGGNAELGCGLVRTTHISGRLRIPTPTRCADWEARWRGWLAREPHAVRVVMTGAWDIFDQKTDEGVVKFGTQAWTDLVTKSMRDGLRVLTSDGRPVYLFEVPCYGKGDPAIPMPERADPARIAAMNNIYAQMQREIPAVHVVHWRDLVCPDGHRRESLNGVRLWENDFDHLTYGGAVEVWKWFLPQLPPGSS